MQRPRHRTNARTHIDQSLADHVDWWEEVTLNPDGSTPEEAQLRIIQSRYAMTPAKNYPTESVHRVASLLNRDPSYIDYQGFLCEITAAAFDDTEQRMAWVECRSNDNGGFVDIAFTLRMATCAKPNTILQAWKLDSYNPYFGCNVQWMAWVGDHVALIYKEKHCLMLASVPQHGTAKLVVLNSYTSAQQASQTVYTPEYQTGLVETLLLPQLQYATPIPQAWLDNQTLPTRTQLALPMMPAELQTHFVRRCFGTHPPQPLADLLIGSLTSSYWLPHPEPATTYHAAKEREPESPIWTPFFRLQTLPAGEDQAFLNVLEQLAVMPCAEPTAELSPLEFACESAAAYIRDRAKVLLEMCHSRRFPEPVSVYFWYGDRHLENFSNVLPHFPQGFQECYAVLLRERETWRAFCEEDRNRQSEERMQRWRDEQAAK